MPLARSTPEQLKLLVRRRLEAAPPAALRTVVASGAGFGRVGLDEELLTRAEPALQEIERRARVRATRQQARGHLRAAMRTGEQAQRAKEQAIVLAALGRSQEERNMGLGGFDLGSISEDIGKAASAAVEVVKAVEVAKNPEIALGASTSTLPPATTWRSTPLPTPAMYSTGPAPAPAVPASYLGDLGGAITSYGLPGVDIVSEGRLASGAACPSAFFDARASMPSTRPKRVLQQVDERGRMHFWRYAGRPVLFSRDARLCKEIRKLAGASARDAGLDVSAKVSAHRKRRRRPR
jgi:hypothetical protein